VRDFRPMAANNLLWLNAENFRELSPLLRAHGIATKQNCFDHFLFKLGLLDDLLERKPTLSHPIAKGFDRFHRFANAAPRIDKFGQPRRRPATIVSPQTDKVQSKRKGGSDVIIFRFINKC